MILVANCKVCNIKLLKHNVCGYCTHCRRTKQCWCGNIIKNCVRSGKHREVNWCVYNFIEVQKQYGWVSKIEWMAYTGKSERHWETTLRVIKDTIGIRERLRGKTQLKEFKIDLL